MFRNTRPNLFLPLGLHGFNTILSASGSSGQNLFLGGWRKEKGGFNCFNTNIVDCCGYEAYFGSRSNIQGKGYG
jgi:hypothetical protein